MGLFFDGKDRKLLELVNVLAERDRQPKAMLSLASPYLHPHGIKELVSSSDMRIASAAIALLNSIEIGRAEERISALQTLRDEIMHSAQTGFRRNTARALLSIIKNLIRSRHDQSRQLILAHDFHETATGKPRKVRKILRRYHLLEMPESWNQMAFDDHVHDANTKGRKSPTHLVMDAWIKGIKYLTVIYYNQVRHEVAAELLEAGRIMNVHIRIGIEIPARFRNKYVRLIWIPRGFLSQQDFLEFLADEPVRTFLDECRVISDYRQSYVLKILRAFNARHRLILNQELEIDLNPVDEEGFLAFVNTGQPSLLHLAEYINGFLTEQLNKKIGDLRREFAGADPDRKQEIESLIGRMNRCDSLLVWERFLNPAVNPELPDPNIVSDDPDIPLQMNRPVSDLLSKLHSLPTGYRITLNLSDLTTEDVLELIYEAQGKITHLETFNLKDYAYNKAVYYQEIDDLRHLINAGNVVGLKRLIRRMIQRLEGENSRSAADRVQTFRKITEDIAGLIGFYKGTPLSARIGSDSAGRSKNVHGMGLAILETLPRRSRREIRHSLNKSREIIPVSLYACQRVTYKPRNRHYQNQSGVNIFLRNLINNYPDASEKQKEWIVNSPATRIGNPGNLTTLGGLQEEPRHQYRIHPSSNNQSRTRKAGFSELNTNLKISLKILLGLIPAFLTFFLTKDWWLLAYFGAFIWFGITSVRNIFQSVLGGSGFRRSPLLRWNEQISWTRIADSLMYTGFSVPLLDYLVKTVMLDRGFGITAMSHPALLYASIAFANGVYIASHNTFRGLPPAAAFGNLFRTILSIPLAMLINNAAAGILGLAGIAATGVILQNWAAVISKAASDTVAGFIEGFVDRSVNLRQRFVDYEDKIRQVQNIHMQLELTYPDRDILELLQAPKQFVKTVKPVAENLEKTLIMNALDLLYFYLFQPRSHTALKILLRNMNADERQVFVRAQSILERKKEISQYLVDGLAGKNFAKALAFYLERVDLYLARLSRLSESLSKPL